MAIRFIFREDELDDFKCEIEWRGHYLNLFIDGKCVDCRSYFWGETEVTSEMMLPMVEEYFNDVLNGTI